MRISARFTAAAIAALFLPLASTAANAEGTLEKIERAGEFVIGYRTDSLPLSFQDGRGQPAGYSVDLCQRIGKGVQQHFADKNIKVKFVPVSSDERISAVVDGTIDIECGATTITLSRQELVDFSLPTFVTGGSVASLRESGIQTITDLDGKRVAVAKGTTTEQQLRTFLSDNWIDAEVVVVGDRTEGWARLNQGNVDAMATDQIVLIGLIMSSPDPTKYWLDSEIFSYEPYGFIVRRDDADFRLVVNRAIAEVYRSGDHADIYYNWIGKAGIEVPPIIAVMFQLGALPE
jgi:glutamate/aspartate transport system substrate-binding protein